MSAPLKIFIIYAREDESFKISLLKAFKPLHRAGKIEIFHNGLIKPGERWEEAILENLRTAHIILPLVSTDFFDSEFIHEVEFKKAVDRYNKGETTIIPIILKHCGWKYNPIIPTLQVLPKDGKPVVTWARHEEAWEQVLNVILEVTEKKKITSGNIQSSNAKIQEFQDLESPKQVEKGNIQNFLEAMKYYNSALNIGLDVPLEQLRNAPLKIFIIYSRKDEKLKTEFVTALKQLERVAGVEVWHDNLIRPGEKWDEVIRSNLRTADIVIPLLSINFFTSDYIQDVEFKNSLDRFRTGETVIVPVILKHCNWNLHDILPTINLLPRGAKPIFDWKPRDKAYSIIVDEVKKIIEEVRQKKTFKFTPRNN